MNQAVYYEGAGKLSVGPAPSAPPGAGEVRIRVSHAGICGTDLHIYRGHMDNRVKMRGGPIGALIALVARENGARVLVSEINPYRLRLLAELGFETVNPLVTDAAELVNERTGGAGADVVFEVTSSQAGAELMTKLPRTRGRIVVVGIFGKPPAVDLHRFFFRELQLFGARVYEREDFERAIALAAAGRLPLSSLVTKALPLSRLEEGFRLMESGGDAMKILLRCGE